MKNAVVAALLLGACLGAAHADDDKGLALEPSVVAALESLGASAAAADARRVAWTSSFNVPPPLNGTMESRVALQYLGHHKWGGQVQTQFNGKTTQMTTLSLCGLIDVVFGSSGGGTEIQSTVPVFGALGALFLPWGIKTTSTLQSGGRTKMLKLGADSGNICQPVSGGRFSYEATIEQFMNFKGQFLNRNKSQEHTIAWSCEVGQPAQVVGPPLSANYLPVTCMGLRADNQKEVTARWAYLTELGFYLPMGKEDGNVFAGKYSEITAELRPQ